ncbi:MAG: hypothetical protein R3E35_09220 [Rhodocyclaceae bacterium]
MSLAGARFLNELKRFLISTSLANLVQSNRPLIRITCFSRRFACEAAGTKSARMLN